MSLTAAQQVAQFVVRGWHRHRAEIAGRDQPRAGIEIANAANQPRTECDRQRHGKQTAQPAENQERPHGFRHGGLTQGLGVEDEEIAARVRMRRTQLQAQTPIRLSRDLNGRAECVVRVGPRLDRGRYIGRRSGLGIREGRFRWAARRHEQEFRAREALHLFQHALGEPKGAARFGQGSRHCPLLLGQPLFGTPGRGEGCPGRRGRIAQEKKDERKQEPIAKRKPHGYSLAADAVAMRRE